MGKVRTVKPRNIKVNSETQGSLYAQETTSEWKPPESLPALDSRYKKIWFDSEWDGKDVFGRSQAIGYSVCLEDDRRFYLPFGHRGGGNLDKAFVHRWAQREFRDKTIVVASGKGDVQMSRKSGLDLESINCRVEDIQYKAALLSDLRRSFKLDDMAFDFLGERKLDLDRSRIWELPAAEVGPYAEHDAFLTKRVDQHLDPAIQEEGLERVLRLENDLIYCVCEMERNGVPLDVPLLHERDRQMARIYEDAIMEVQQATSLRVSPQSGHDLARLANMFGIVYPMTTPEPTPKNPDPKPQPSFTDAFLQTLDNEHFKKLRRARSINSIRSKYVTGYLKRIRDGILRFQLHQLKGDEFGTISGRFSSSNPNIQQVYKPSRQKKKLGSAEFLVRQVFIPYYPGENPNDWEWIKADARQIEFRLFVHYSRSERLIQKYVIDPLIDFHNIVQELLERYREIDRDDTKNINFGKLYAMGRAKMARQMGLPRDVADQLFDLYDEMFPEAKELLNLSMEIAESRGHVKTLLGRRARFPEGSINIHSALNRVLQGSAADIMKMKLLEVYNNRKLLNLIMFLTVHDELDGRIPRGGPYKQMLQDLLDTQISELKLRVPILWEVSTGRNWAEAA